MAGFGAKCCSGFDFSDIGIHSRSGRSCRGLAQISFKRGFHKVRRDFNMDRARTSGFHPDEGTANQFCKVAGLFQSL